MPSTLLLTTLALGLSSCDAFQFQQQVERTPRAQGTHTTAFAQPQPQPQSQPQRAPRFGRTRLAAGADADADDEAVESDDSAESESASPSGDWRAFRASLIAREAKEKAASDQELGGAATGVAAGGAESEGLDSAPSAAISTATSTPAVKKGAEAGWVYETPLIEQGAVILGGTQSSFGFGLNQQYFHKWVSSWV